MRFLVLLTILVVSANASVVEKLGKFIPSLATPYVVKGQEAAPHSAPYIVSLGRKGNKHSHICGGTIINAEWVLTAAHCVSKPIGMSVYAGLHLRLETNTTSTQRRFVDFGIRHQHYEGGVAPNDIALLHVSEPFKLNSLVQPATLPPREYIHTGNVSLYGWGQTKPFLPVASKTLQTVQTEVLDWDECKNTLPESAPLAPSNVCTSAMKNGVSACNGDSGGPLVAETKGAPSQLVGIVSWGIIPCGVANMPSVYTRVSAFIDWIANVQSSYYILS